MSAAKERCPASSTLPGKPSSPTSDLCRGGNNESGIRRHLDRHAPVENAMSRRSTNAHLSAGSRPVIVTRIALVDDHPALLRGVAALLASDERYQIVGTGLSADEAVTLVKRDRPDILTLDLSMPGDVFAAIEEIVAHSAKIKIIIFTAFASIELALKALHAGAHAFVLKGSPLEDLYAAIDAVIAGDHFVSPDLLQQLLSATRHNPRHDDGVKTRLEVALAAQALRGAKGASYRGSTEDLT
jgi:DNA-binding NarL/FixJ family response regulator